MSEPSSRPLSPRWGQSPTEANMAAAPDAGDARLAPPSRLHVPGSGAASGLGQADSLSEDTKRELVAIPMGTGLEIELERPLTTKSAYAGQSITFRSTAAFALENGLEVPPGIRILGHVAEVKRPGLFGKSAVLRLMADRMVIAGSAPVRLRGQLRPGPAAAVEGLSLSAKGPFSRSGLAVLSLQGALAGSQFGGKPAAIGAGTGIALAAVLIVSQRGQEVNLPARAPFYLRLAQESNLPLEAVIRAQQEYAEGHPAGDSADPDPDFHPKLKRRLRPPQS